MYIPSPFQHVMLEAHTLSCCRFIIGLQRAVLNYVQPICFISRVYWLNAVLGLVCLASSVFVSFICTGIFSEWMMMAMTRR